MVVKTLPKVAKPAARGVNRASGQSLSRPVAAPGRMGHADVGAPLPSLATRPARQMLVSALPPRQNRPMPVLPDEPEPNACADIPVAKRYPYLSETKGREALAMNGKITLPNEVPDAAGSTTVRCRHLAAMYADAPKKADFFEAVASPELMASTFEGKLAGLSENHKARMAATPESAKRVVAGSELGGYLAQVAASLDAQPAPLEGEPRQANILINTLDHAMAIQVQRKVNAERGGEYFAVSLYDPNLTTNHRRVEVAHADDLKNLSLNSFIPPNVVNDYAKGSTELFMAAYCQGADLPPDEAGSKQTHPMLIGRQMSMAMRGNVSQTLQSLLDDLPQLSRADQLAVLRGEVVNGVTGLYFAMQDGYENPVKMYAQGVLASDLQASDKAALLRGGSKDASALCIAMRQGSHGSVSQFVQAVAHTPCLNADQKTELLAGKRASGKTALGVALEKNQGEAVRAYCHAVLHSPALSDQQKVELLTAHDAKGVPALKQPGVCADAEAALRQSVRESTLTPALKAQLLAP